MATAGSNAGRCAILPYLKLAGSEERPPNLRWRVLSIFRPSSLQSLHNNMYNQITCSNMEAVVTILLIVVVVLLLFGGGGYYGYRRRW